MVLALAPFRVFKSELFIGCHDSKNFKCNRKKVVLSRSTNIVLFFTFTRKVFVAENFFLLYHNSFVLPARYLNRFLRMLEQWSQTTLAWLCLAWLWLDSVQVPWLCSGTSVQVPWLCSGFCTLRVSLLDCVELWRNCSNSKIFRYRPDGCRE